MNRQKRPRKPRSRLQKLASAHNWLHYKLQRNVLSAIYDLNAGKTLTDESRHLLREVEEAVKRLKASMKHRRDPEERVYD